MPLIVGVGRTTMCHKAHLILTFALDIMVAITVRYREYLMRYFLYFNYSDTTIAQTKFATLYTSCISMERHNVQYKIP